MIASKSKTCCLLAKKVSKLFCTCAATPPDPRGQRSLSSRYITGFVLIEVGGACTLLEVSCNYYFVLFWARIACLLKESARYITGDYQEEICTEDFVSSWLDSIYRELLFANNFDPNGQFLCWSVTSTAEGS